MRAAGLEPDPELVLVAEAFTESEGARLCEQLMAAGRDFTAVAAANDLLALGCYDVFAERGVRCPEDVSVVGFNDMPFAARFQPPLTTIHIPHYEIGKAAGGADARAAPGRGLGAARDPARAEPRGPRVGRAQGRRGGRRVLTRFLQPSIGCTRLQQTFAATAGTGGGDQMQKLRWLVLALLTIAALAAAGCGETTTTAEAAAAAEKPAESRSRSAPRCP